MSDKFWLEEATKHDYADPDISTPDTVASIIVAFEPAVSGKNPVIVEIGCGYGRLVKIIQGMYPAATVIGTDINAKVLEHAKALCGSKPKFKCTTQLDDKANAIYSVQVFQHISYEAKQLYIHKAANALKRGGVMRIQFVEGHHSNDRDLSTYTNRADFEKWAKETGLKLRHYELALVVPTWAWVTLEKPLTKGAKR